MSLGLLNGSSLLQPSSTIPSDITFSIVEQLNGSEMPPHSFNSSTSLEPSKVTTFTAHKYYLAAVSPVFATQFFGSMLEENSETVLTDVTARAFNCMLDLVYRLNVDLIDKSNLRELFEALYVAEKYMIERMKELIQAKFEFLPVTRDNVVEVTRTALEFKHFQKAFETLLKHVSNVLLDSTGELYMTTAPIEELFDIAVDSMSEDLMESVFNGCHYWLIEFDAEVDFDAKFFWYCVKFGLKIVNDQTLSENMKTKAKALVDDCLEKFKEEDIKRIIRGMDFATDDCAGVLFQFMKAFKQCYCDNCKSSPCKNGKDLDSESVAAGCKVEEKEGLKRIGTVVKGKMLIHADLDIDDDDERYVDVECPDICKIELFDGSYHFDDGSNFVFKCK